ncbi:PFGI-1 class ICE element type IV pilus protein PilL2 [Endothiovibrio diazotrophicus]
MAAPAAARYFEVRPLPTAEQIDPLGAVVDLSLPASSVRDIGEALTLLLRPAGYRLPRDIRADGAMGRLLTLPVPAPHHSVRRIRLDQAVAMLVAPAYRPVVDPVHRLISFEPVEGYAELISESGGTVEAVESSTPDNVEASTPPAPDPIPASEVTSVPQVWTVREGSFRDNLVRLAAEHQWAEPVWELPEGTDFRVRHAYGVHGADVTALSAELARGYPLKLCIYPVNQTLRVVPPGTTCQREVVHAP